MGSLKWEDVPTKTSSQQQSDSATGNPWFGVTMGLIGVIVGYIIANLHH